MIDNRIEADRAWAETKEAVAADVRSQYDTFVTEDRSRAETLENLKRIQEEQEKVYSKYAGITKYMTGTGVAQNALDIQVGGNHYKKLKIQPVEYIHANGLGFCEGNAIKYLSRWRDKGGVADLEKAKHYIELLIELETRK